jgi:hypothetical protein
MTVKPKFEIRNAKFPNPKWEKRAPLAGFHWTRSYSNFEIRISNFSHHFPIVKRMYHGMLRRVNRLTKQEQLVLCVIVGLLLLGWTVKIYRTAHPPNLAAEKLKP